MVIKWGLSEKLGPLTYGEDEGEVFLGHSVTQHKNVSGETANLIDEEVRKIIDENYDRAEKILVEHMDKLHMMADTLMKYETIDQGQIGDIMAGKTPKPPEDWSDQPPLGPSGKEDKKEAKTKDSKTDGSIGGPAGEH